ncbi:hypothetical protein Ancab_001710 [Ancistrocladus abbreviatus]
MVMNPVILVIVENMILALLYLYIEDVCPINVDFQPLWNDGLHGLQVNVNVLKDCGDVKLWMKNLPNEDSVNREKEDSIKYLRSMFTANDGANVGLLVPSPLFGACDVVVLLPLDKEVENEVCLIPSLAAGIFCNNGDVGLCVVYSFGISGTVVFGSKREDTRRLRSAEVFGLKKRLGNAWNLNVEHEKACWHVGLQNFPVQGGKKDLFWGSWVMLESQILNVKRLVGM